MRALTVKSRLVLVLALLIVLMLLVGLLGLRGMQLGNASLATVYMDRTVPLVDLSAVDQAMRDARSEWLLVALHAPDLEGKVAHDRSHGVEAHLSRITELEANATRLWDAYMKTYLTEDEKKLAADYESHRRTVAAAFAQGRQLIQSGKWAEFDAHVQSVVYGQITEAGESMGKLAKLQADVAAEEYRGAVDRFDSTRLWAIGLLLSAVLMAVISGWLLLRAIVVPLRAAGELAGRIAGGDLRGRILAHSTDEVGVMVASLQQMQDKLLEVVRQVQGATSSISSAAREISSGNQNLSSRTEQQASSLEETASAMEQMTSTVRQNSDSARAANQVAEGTRQQAERGGAVVREAIGAMQEVSEASRRITAIIGVIDEIAFQTNLLALNAAVEAARAGDMGRGFAVVANEVRNLAQRSASAAKEIKGLIQDTVAKIEAGAELVNRSGSTLDLIVKDVKQVGSIVAEIAAASAEQSTGIDEVGRAVMQMDEMTQQNAALVEEAAAAAEEMEGQAHTLEEMMRFFRVDDGPATRAAGAPPAVRPAAAVPAPAAAPRPRAAPAPARARLAPAARPAPAPAPSRAAPGADEAGDWEEF